MCSTPTTSRITASFAALRAQNRAALVPYVTAGDPDFDTSLAVLEALADGGADVIELGVPFSDPMADGPVIEAAMGRALAGGMTLARVLELVSRFRSKHATPVVLFGYLNPLYSSGLAAIAARAKEAGADGFLVVDLPPEEAAQLTDHTKTAGLDVIALFTPTSDDARVEAIGAAASGFAYYVSMASVTGDALTDFATVRERVARVRELAGLPVAVGFGIRSEADAITVARFADGVVIGSALVAALHAAGADAPAVARAWAERYRAAIDGARSV